MSDYGICNDCRRSFRTTQAGTWIKVEGWIVNRGGKGGANAIRNRLRETGPILCPACGKQRELQAMPGQTSIFDGA